MDGRQNFQIKEMERHKQTNLIRANFKTSPFARSLRPAQILTRLRRVNPRNTQCIPLVNPAEAGSPGLDLEQNLTFWNRLFGVTIFASSVKDEIITDLMVWRRYPPILVKRNQVPVP